MLAHIVRIDSRNNHGWQVRLNLSGEASSQYESKLFSDGPCGGKRNAKKLAEEYLRSELRQHGMEELPLGRRKGMMFLDDPERVCRSNTSGRTGVYRGEHTRQLANGTQQVRYYAASYTIGPDGKRKNRTRRFYYGKDRTEDEARELAIQFREEWEEAYLSGGVRAVRAFFKEWSST